MSTTKTQLSVIILSRPDDPQLEKAQRSVEFADQVLIIENSSITDFAQVRNQALSQVKHQWVLFVDSDEVLASSSIPMINNIIEKNQADGIWVKRSDVFYGQILKFGEAGQMKLLRLAKKNVMSWRRPVHEVAQVRGRVESSQIQLYHQAHHTVDDFIQRVTYYAQLEAQYRLQQGTDFSLLELVVWPWVKFFYNYVLRLGFLDGWPGLIYALMMSVHSLAVRVFIYELREKNT